MSSYINFPIAIVGAACRLPGNARSLDGLWNILSQGYDAVTKVPLSRWDTSSYLHPRRDMPGHTVSVSAGIIDDIFDFDPGFFGISRTEAEAMDPQQKLLLELTWEALEDAGIRPSSLSGSDTAVFVGAASPDAGTSHADDICATSPYSMTGTNLSIISNRISYIYNFHGPSMTIDTACSSAMHALHQACLELAAGNAGMAVAGGVNVLLAPYPFVGFSQAHMLSPEGRCKVFDASGDGYVRSEGGGIVLLQPLSEALAQGRHIHAVIRGIGINSDGRTQGIALPSASAQEELLRGVYDAAGCKPDRLAYVEAHGTGTAVGDPIETSAIGRALGQRRSTPLWVGSVKCNVGHLETASAMAGLMKSLLVLREGRIPPQIHLNNINPAIDCSALNLRFPLKTEPLPEVDGKRYIGINSFGFGGSNGHLLLEAADPAKSGKRIQTSVPPMFISASSEESLHRLAESYAERIEKNPDSYYDLASGAHYRRELLSKRLVAEGDTPKDVALALRGSSSEGESASCGAAEGEAVPPSKADVRTAFVFSGNGGQWTGMGRDMMANPAFAKAANEVAQLMEQYSEKDLLEIMNNATDEDMAHTDTAQQLLFLIQVGLCAALDAVGIRADAAFGHSVGEIAAAWYCGAVSLKEAVRIIYYRSMHQESTAGAGRMAAASIGADEAADLAERYGDVEIAGINAADAVTLSGSGETLAKIGKELKSRHIFFKMLPLNYAFHSSRMESIHRSLLDDLASIETRAPKLHFISSITGKEHTEGCPASYWWDNVRKPVNFRGAEQTAISLGVRHFLEIGPHSILLRYLRSGLDKADCMDGGQVEGWTGGTLSRNSGVEQFGKAWKAAWIGGWPADLSKHFDRPADRVDLPLYPWNNAECRLAATPECRGFVNSIKEHPLLGRRLHNQNVWENVIDTEGYPWIRDHKVGDTVYYPAAAYIEMALAVLEQISQKDEKLALCNTSILRPVILRERQPLVIRTSLSESDDEIRMFSRPYMRDEPWTLNARARIIHTDVTARKFDKAGHPEQFGEPVSAAKLYEITQKANMNYGSVFRSVECGWIENSVMLSRFRHESGDEMQDWSRNMLIPPPLLDGSLQPLFAIIENQVDKYPAPRLPYWFERCILIRRGYPVYARTHVPKSTRHGVVCNVSIFDINGDELLRLEGGRARTVEQLAAPRPSVYATYAVPQPHPSAEIPDGMPSIHDLSEKLREKSDNLTDTDQWRHYTDEILPLRELAGIALADELENSDAGFRFADLTVRLQQYAAARGNEVTDSLPGFDEIWCTLAAEAPHDSAVNMLLANARRTLLGNEEPISCSHPLRLEYRRQEYRTDSILCRHALEEYIKNAASPVSILEINAEPSSLGRISGQQLSRHFRILAAQNDAELKQLSLACEAMDASVQDAPVEVVEWNIQKEKAPVKVHAAVAFHCLSSADDIPAVLERCRDALHENGLLILAESEPNITDDIIFGQEESWWITSKSSPDSVSRQLAPQEWEKALQDAGFTDIEVIKPDPAVPRFIILAKSAGKETADEIRASEQTTWVLCTDSGIPPLISSVLDRISQNASLRGDTVIHLTGGEKLCTEGNEWQCSTDDADQWKSVWETLAGENRPAVLIDALSLGGDGLDPGAAGLQCSALVQAVRGWNAAGRPAASLRLLTVNAQPSPDNCGKDIRPSQASLIGAARVLMNEVPSLGAFCIDMHMSAGDENNTMLINSAVRELMHPSKEHEVILKGAMRYVLRSENTTEKSDVKSGNSLKLECTVPGHLETLRWVPAPVPEPKGNEVRVKVHATGLNFRDVMWAMNMLPEEALENGFSGPGLGIECSGVVEATGSEVSGITAGQRVLCFGSQCFADCVLTTSDAVTQIPDEWSFADAATIPVAFFTAWYAIRHLANMQSGERILIHGAAGGVGLAAIQIASTLGLEVYATAGSDDKRSMLSLLGVEHIYDSRSYSFHDQIMQDTNGEGVDAVLNSLAGEGIDQSLRLLRPYGRFLELGKRDFYADNSIRIRPFRNNISFFGIDVDQFIKDRPDLGRRIFSEIMEHFRNGDWTPLQYSLYASDEAEHAYRAMQQSRHVGKIVIEPPARTKGSAETEVGTALDVHTGGSYIITGGLGGFGLETARRLAMLGAGALILISRRGATEDNAAALEELATLGLKDGQKRTVTALAQDVTDYESLAGSLDRVLAELPPLKGVVHAAAVLDDGIITDMTPERIQRVLSPKLAGAFNLHRYTLNSRLDFFIMYSSATTLLGNPGQVNYVAANQGLEALAALRRGMGLPGLAVGWSAISDAGMLARDRHTLDSLIRVTGLTPLTSAGALDALAKLPADCHPAPAIFSADWKKLSRLPAAKLPRFSHLRADDDSTGDHEESIGGIVRSLSPEKALTRVTEIVTATVARIMRVPVSSVKPGKPLADMGMDSLMSVELMVALEEKLEGQSLMGGLSAGASIRDVAERIVSLFRDNGSGSGDIRSAMESSHNVSMKEEFADRVIKDVEGRGI